MRAFGLLACALTSTLMIGNSWGAECRVLPITRTPDPSVFEAGAFRFRITGADNPAAPSAWDGQIETLDRSTGRRLCAGAEDLYGGPLSAFENGYLALYSSSGSGKGVVTIDLNTCRPVGHYVSTGPVTPVFQDGQIRVRGKAVRGLPCNGEGGGPRRTPAQH